MIKWEPLFGLYPGWAKWKQLRVFLEDQGYVVKQINGTPNYDPEKSYIARIQWTGPGVKKEKPYYGWDTWYDASCHTHFIVIENGKFFCNETGWMDYQALQFYLGMNSGVITSHLEITKPTEVNNP